jgi:hypothetical protein
MKLLKYLLFRASIGKLTIGLAAIALPVHLAKATPYASGVTNTGGGTIQFYINEGGGVVTVTYEDGSTNAAFTGTTTVAAGVYTFALGAHTSYSIQCYKVGAGVPTFIASSPAFTPRGMDVNKNPTSPYFGRIYVSKVSSPNGIYSFNANWSVAAGPTAAGITLQGGNVFEPYRLYVADDDRLMVGDGGYDNAGVTTLSDGVWRVAPDLSGSQLFLGPAGQGAGVSAGVHSAVISRPWIIGNVQAGGPVTLLDVDGDFSPNSKVNSLLLYTNITLAALPWQNPPDIVGPEVGLNINDIAIANVYPGLQIGKTGASQNYIYCSTYRGNYSNPCLQIYTNDIFTSATLALVWDSITADGGTVGTGPDFYSNVSDANGANPDHTVDIGVSPDGRYVANLIRPNWFVITPLTNGLPDTGNLFKSAPTAATTIARGMAWDAADNLYLSSSGLGLCQSWSLGITSTATTTGNASGATGFNVVFPSTKAYVVATQNFASQGGNNGVPGTPVPGVFTITRTNANNDYSQPVTVSFTLSGTAGVGVYTTSPSAGITVAGNGSVVIAAGQTSTNISIVPTTANVPRPQTTVILTVKGGSSYSVGQPASDTVYIQNTSTNQLVLTAAAATMYKAFSNDYASITVTRWGDTSAPPYTAAAFTYSGTALPNVDFVAPAALDVHPGDLTFTPHFLALSNGVPPVDVANPLYVGNKSFTVTLPGGSSYIVGSTNSSTTLTLLDNAYPPAPVLFSDPLTDPADASNWAITYASGNLTQEDGDYNVDFGYDLTANNPNSGVNGLIGLPPSGATNALRITCNKQRPNGTFGGGVNVYYKNQAFSGNYAVRFNMNMVIGTGGFTIEGPLFGINHNGLETNWWLATTANFSGGPWASDGVWYWIQGPPDGAGGFVENDFEEYTGAGGMLPNTGWVNLANVLYLTNVFKHAVFTAPGGVSGGTPANNSPVSATPMDNSWSDVEIKQINNVVSLTIDKTAIFNYTNTTKFTNGYLMLGFNSPIGGAFNNYFSPPEEAAYFSNLRVVSIGRPLITSISDSPSGNNNNVTIQFTSTDGDDTPASFALQSAANVTPASGYADVTATITQVATTDGTAKFQATATSTGTKQFYRIRHK